jgi:hypothetical protein
VIKKFQIKLRSGLIKFSGELLDLLQGFMVASHPEWNPRAWSNLELRKFASGIDGDVINISAATDSDKVSARYRNYFTSARSYSISNYGQGVEGGSGTDGEILLDLSKPYDGPHGLYDAVFSHTVLEHVYELETALDTICALSRDLVITVVPFLQCFHGREGSYTDYWRLSPPALNRLFLERGFKTIYCSWNDSHPLNNVYVFHVASRFSERHTGQFSEAQPLVVGSSGPGVEFSNFLWGDGVRRNAWRRIGEALGRCFAVNQSYP